MISKHQKKISTVSLFVFSMALLLSASGLVIRHAFVATPGTHHEAGTSAVQEDSLYNRLISKADNLFFVSQYNEAKTEYEKAAQLKPQEKYPKDQIQKINQILGQTMKKQEDYQSVIASADKYLESKDYLNAKAAYQLATEIKPDDPYPRQQLATVMETIRSQKAQNILYDVAIANAEKFLSAKDYEKAKIEFQNALNILPGAQYPKDKINEITKIQIDAQVKEELYKQSIDKADQYFEEKILPASRTEYQKASLLKPEEKYPKERIKEIDALLAAQKGTDDAYNQAIALADKYFKDQSYPNARKEYEKASGIKPAEIYPIQQIRKIDDLLTSQANTKLRYDQYIGLADSLYILKDFAEALRNYRNALGVKPGESYPQQMIEKASKLLSNSEEEAKILQESYLAAIAEADKLFGEQFWSKALEAYQRAGNLKPAESYPKQKIKEINDLLAANQKKEDDYATSIAKGDAKMTEKAYAEALTAYQSASTIKPAEQYPKDKIAEINKLLADIKAKDDTYNEAIAKADKLLVEKSYSDALNAYQSASTMKPDETYPKTKITEINTILSALKSKDEAYQAAIASGDKLLGEKKYTDALASFQQALSIKPEETYPKTKADEINKILADLKAKEDAYQAKISEADKLFTDKTYQPAITAYQDASAIKPEEQYPKQKIKEITDILEVLKNKEAAYQAKIAAADKYLAEKSYQPALTTFGEASSIKPEETYPKTKIEEINGILGDIKAKDDAYAAAISTGDAKMTAKAYSEALTAYQSASSIKPAEQYPKDKIAEINKLLADIKAKDDAYNEAITLADKLLVEKSFSDALSAYQSASTIKPDETYPKTKITEISTILSALKSKDEAYQAAIASGDKLLGEKKYTDALASFQQALTIKPEESYPKTKADEINKILADLKAKEDAYQAKINEADKLFTDKSYQPAIAAYQGASTIKPEEQYPKQKIKEITDILEVLKNKEAAYQAKIAAADKAFAEKLYPPALTAYGEASTIKPEETYPKTKIEEINGILADIKAKDDAFAAAISTGDAKMTGKAYAEALTAYQNASSIKPAEQYPKEKIAEINKLLADIKAKDDAYSEAITRADRLFGEQSYMEALAAFQSASTIKPEEAYPKTKITEINNLLAELKSKDDAYKAAIASGDKLFGEKKYTDALASFQQALTIKPEETYPKTKSDEIDKILADLKAKEDAYQAKVTEADKLFTDKSYQPAITAYQDASTIKPEEQYPRQKIKEINDILEALKNAEASYKIKVAAADRMLAEKSYQQALTAYQEASTIKPEEAYPKTKMDEINGILAEIRQRDAAYLDAIAAGDKLMSEKSYDSSLVYFRKALQIKHAETYPQQKIKELNNLLADLRGRQQMYEELVIKGNQSMEKKDYPEAKDFFVQASNILPEESYPKNKITEIEKIMAEMERLNREKYNKAISEADGFYNNEIFDKAIESYELASGYLPYEPYPKERIRKIKKYLRENALVNILDSPVNISSNNEKKFEFSPINVAARKNNYVFIRIRNLSTKDLNVMLRYGKEGQINGGIVMRSFPPGEVATERLVSVREQDPWYREDNNWISVYPQGGDIEVSFIQINRAIKIE